MADKTPSKKMAAAPAAKPMTAASSAAGPAPAKTTGSTAAMPAKSPTPAPAARGKVVDAAERLKLIQQAAYYRSLARGVAADPVQDWLAAEREVDRRLSG